MTKYNFLQKGKINHQNYFMTLSVCREKKLENTFKCTNAKSVSQTETPTT